VDKAAVLVVPITKYHPLPDGKKRLAPQRYRLEPRYVRIESRIRRRVVEIRR
jgi:hypothetical protein